MPQYPFKASFDDIQSNADYYIDSVFSSLESEFLVMPKGAGFVEYFVFERGYEALKRATGGFKQMVPDQVLSTAVNEPISIVVLRAMLGFTPPEWAYLTTQRTGVKVDQGFVRSLDRKVRLSPDKNLKERGASYEKLKTLVETACQMLAEGAAPVNDDQLHRLSKADTKRGLDSIIATAELGAPYAMLLYERFLGRPFAGHRDSVSELVGDSLESAIEDILARAGVSYRKTKRAERIEGFDQAPDFIIPSEFNPHIIIEAKITEDDGTARDKVTRIQQLAELSRPGRLGDEPKFEVIACIGGRGFSVRREDMKKMLIAARGKVFTLKTLCHLIENTKIKEYRSK